MIKKNGEGTVGKANISKVIARISGRGSNSFNLSNIAPQWAEKIANARIDYTKDIEQEIYRPFREQVEGGLLGDVQNRPRTVTPGDGQMIGSFEFHAMIAVGMRIISENEYTEFKELWEACGKDVSKVGIGSKLYKLINRIPSVFQIRHGSKKGICVRYNLEAIDRTKNIDAIVPKSVRKFVDGDWNSFPLEICNYLKRKKEWVALNPQFIGALQYENPNALNDIVRYWLDYAEASLNDHAKAQQFHGIIKSSDEDEDTVASNLTAALRFVDLINESQVCNWRKDQYRKFFKDMQIGRILVPGVYSYMICDPAFLVARTYGIDVPHLATNEYFFNGKEGCNCGLFRSPLIHPSEAQRVQLCNKENYWYYQNVMIFNGYDGIWDRMGGADFDGDICAIIPDDTEFGRIVCSGIKDYGYDIVIPSIGAKEVPFTLDNLIKHLVKTAHPDRTGKITNESMSALDIANHLRGLLYFAKTFYKCETITFIHPKMFGENLGRKHQGEARLNANNQRTLCTKGFVTVAMDRDSGIKFGEISILGEKTFDEVAKTIEYYEDLAGSGKVCVGMEIDGAKTGVYAEGIDGTRYPDALQMKYCAHHSISRKESLGRPVSDAHRLNTYHSLSALGRIHDLVGDWDTPGSNAYKINEQLSSGSNKMFLLYSLLTDEERGYLNLRWNMTDGTVQGLVDMFKARKKAYNTDIRNLIMNTSDSEQTLAMRTRKEREIEEIYALCKSINVPTHVGAVAAYIATYDKDSKQNNALTYGWLLFDELLSVFSRGNSKFELFRLPANVESVRIESGNLYVNDRKYMSINAEDCDAVPIKVINCRNYAHIHKKVQRIEAQRGVNVVYNSTVYTIGAFGFKHHIAAGAGDLKQVWKQIIAQNGYVCDITMDATNRAVISVNGKSIAALMNTTNFELMNKRIKFVNSHDTIKETAATITGLQCVIIGEAGA